MLPNAWRCEVPVPRPPFRRVLDYEVALDQSYCERCGSPNDMHPIDICSECPHMVRMHGADTDGCGRIWAEGWCVGRLTFGRESAEFVIYG
jgi:hypothetical protein